jgi:hypothetical protein
VEQDTRKISAAQLAEVLAKVDNQSRSGTRPKDEPAPAKEPAPVSAPPQVLAVVERPVTETNVVNLTSPQVPPSSGKLPIAKDAKDAKDESDVPEHSNLRAVVNTPEPEPEATKATAEAEAAAAQLVVDAGQSGRAIGVLLLVLVFVAGCVSLVWLNH